MRAIEAVGRDDRVAASERLRDRAAGVPSGIVSFMSARDLPRLDLARRRDFLMRGIVAP